VFLYVKPFPHEDPLVVLKLAPSFSSQTQPKGQEPEPFLPQPLPLLSSNSLEEVLVSLHPSGISSCNPAQILFPLIHSRRGPPSVFLASA